MKAKADAYFSSNKVKTMKAHRWGYGILQYGISQDDYIKMKHIMSLILYCDFTEYCTSFSSTFRKISMTETMEDVKMRNSAYWHQSKSFREAVECFGALSPEATDYMPDDMQPVSGPFFSGLNCVLAIPEFSLRLKSPTSTSVHIEVSLKFASKTGIIIQLNNPGTHMSSTLLPILDVSWLSRYPDEDERVFTGLSKLLSFCSL